MKSALLLAAALGLMPGVSIAANHAKTQTLSVRGSVSQDCTLSTNPMTFPSIGVGYIHPSGKAVLVQSSLDVRCTKGSVVSIAMNNGLYGSAAGAQFGSRSMKASPGADYLGYDLCHDSACARIWSPAGYIYTSPTDTGSTLAVWGRILTGQKSGQGSYADVVTVTVSF